MTTTYWIWLGVIFLNLGFAAIQHRLRGRNGAMKMHLAVAALIAVFWLYAWSATKVYPQSYDDTPQVIHL